MTRLGPMPLGEEALQGANGDRTIDMAAAARSLAGVSANASADARHGIRIARNTIRLFKAPLGDQRHITAGIGMRGTRYHAGEIGVQPFPIDLLVSEAYLH